MPVAVTASSIDLYLLQGMFMESVGMVTIMGHILALFCGKIR